MRRTILWIVAILVASFLQTTWLDLLRVEGVLPDLVLIVVVYFAASDGPEKGMFTGVIGGAMQDVASDAVLGHHVLCNVVVGYAAGQVAARLVTEHAAVKAGLVFCGSLLQGLLFVLVRYIQQPRLNPARAFLGGTVPEAFYTALITPLVFFALDRLFHRETSLFGGPD